MLSRDLPSKLRAAIQEGESIRTIAQGRPNEIIEISVEGVRVATERSLRAGSGPQLVPGWMIQQAYDELCANGTVSAQHLVDDMNIKRSTAVCALLARLPEVGVRTERPTVLEITDGTGRAQ